MANVRDEHRITVGQLRAYLASYPADAEVTFGATLEAVPLEFFRVKSRGQDLVQIELNEVDPDKKPFYLSSAAAAHGHTGWQTLTERR